MDVVLPYMIQDRATATHKDMKFTESFVASTEPFFLDGAVTRRVAVLDFDEKTGELLPGPRFLPPTGGRKRGRYEIADEDDHQARDFNQVSVLATVLDTLYMFEEEGTLGREIEWAFDGPQLLVVPRAGEWANAFYERDSRSLQFFYFTSDNPSAPGRTIYTSLSHDIVSHETAHAILDGIAPDLYNALTPQALALHEAIADLAACVMAFRSHNLRETVLRDTGGSIADPTAFGWIGEEFGRARDASGRAGYLRSLINRKTLDPHDTSVDDLGRANRVSVTEPHELSQVLTGALYGLAVDIHERLKRRFMAKDGRTEFQVSGKALGVGAGRFQRMIFRGLDYLPPGEVSFADYGRAVLASDKASYPDETAERDYLRTEFAKRHIVTDPGDLEVRTDFAHEAVRDLDLDALVEQDWTAYEFANRWRDFLGIPHDIHFWVRPRLKVEKLYHYRSGKKKVKECIFKVSWDQEEDNPRRARLPGKRQVTVGTTLAIDWETRRVRALLTSGQSEAQREARSEMLSGLLDRGVLQFGAAPPELESGTRVWVESSSGLMRVRGSGRLLHIADRDEEDE